MSSRKTDRPSGEATAVFGAETPEGHNLEPTDGPVRAHTFDGQRQLQVTGIDTAACPAGEWNLTGLAEHAVLNQGSILGQKLHPHYRFL
jgi:hypothetical protein